MKVEHNFPLADYTSFRCGGNAETAVIVDDISQLATILKTLHKSPVWILGFGSNIVVSDNGLPGTTLILKKGATKHDQNILIADAGVWWDDLVQCAIENNLWGIECMSAIPGGVGAAVVGNVAAYGQAISDTLLWAEMYDLESKEIKKINAKDLQLEYRRSAYLQNNRSLVVLRAAFKLSPTLTKNIEYESALSVARDNNYDLNKLSERRRTIIEAREHAGSLWDYRDEGASKTAGSFFRNPVVDTKKAEFIMAYDETGKSLDLLQKMNKVHGGDTSRVSAAHVLLAAGFKRGQTWGDVRLHPRHILKIENAGSAHAQDIYHVSQEITSIVKQKLDITLEPEVRFLGDF